MSLGEDYKKKAEFKVKHKGFKKKAMKLIHMENRQYICFLRHLNNLVIINNQGESNHLRKPFYSIFKRRQCLG